MCMSKLDGLNFITEVSTCIVLPWEHALAYGVVVGEPHIIM